jgi:hypothetical protein
MPKIGDTERWPSPGDFRVAVQSPAAYFKSPELKESQPETNGQGLPTVRSGQFASVYRFKHATGDTSSAVRVFHFKTDETNENRYKRISAHLQKLKLPWMIGFRYLPGELRVKVAKDAVRYPVLVMEFFPGVTLGNWVEAKVAAGDTAALRAVADEWVKLVKDLEANQIVHGDLQHNNVMVDDNRLVLVDYDCMIVGAETDGISDSCELDLMPAVKDAKEIPRAGKNRLIVARVDQVLHFRRFDLDGIVVANTNEKRLPDQAKPLEDLKKQLAGLWPPRPLAPDEKKRLITAVVAIIGRDRPRESGLAAYQHPLRMNPRRSNPKGRPVEISPYLDTYSALVILTALRALAADVSLFERYMTRIENDNLLFTPNDHAEPKQSKLFDELARSKDPQVVEYAARLREWAAGPIGKHKGIGSVVRDPFSPIRDAIKSGDWETVIQRADALAKAKPPAALPLPPEIQDAVKSAREKVEALKRLRDALAAKDPRKIVAVLQATGPVLAGWPAAKGVVAEAEKSRPVVRRLDDLKAQVGTPTLKAKWNEHRNHVPKCPETIAYNDECALRDAAEAKDWTRLVPLVYPKGPSGFAVPGDLAAVVSEASARGAARDALAKALDAQDQAATAAALKSLKGRADWGDCAQLVARAQQLVEGASALDELAKSAGSRKLLDDWKRLGPKVAALEGAKRYRDEVELWNAADSKQWSRIVPLVYPPGRLAFAVPGALKAVVDTAARKGRAKDALSRAVADKNGPAVATALPEAEKELAGWTDPECVELLAKARAMGEQTAALDELKAQAGTPALVAAWLRLENKVASSPEAARFRAEVELWQAAKAKQWDRVAARAAAAKFPVPDGLRPSVENARNKVGLRNRLQAAVDSGLVRDVARALAETGTDLDDWEDPACKGLLAAARTAAAKIALLERLEKIRNTPALPDELDKHAAALKGVGEAASLWDDAKAWRRKNAALAALRSAAQTGISERKIAELAQVLEQAGGHPQAGALSDRVALAVARIVCLDVAARHAQQRPPSEEADLALRQAWDDAKGDTKMAGCTDTEAAAAQQRYREAAARLDALKEAEAAAAMPGEGERPHESRFVEALTDKRIPKDYKHRMTDRLKTARLRVQALDRLDQALKTTPASFLAVGAAYDDVLRVKARAPREYQAPVGDALERRTELKRVESNAPPSSLPRYDQDVKWRTLWNDKTDRLLRGSADAAAVVARRDEAVKMLDAFKKLEEALAENDPIRVMAAAEILGDYPALQAHKSRIDAMQADYGKIKSLTDALKQYATLADEPSASFSARDAASSAVRANWDAGLLARYPAIIVGARELLERWLRDHVLHRPPRAANPPFSRDRNVPRRVRVQWSSPDQVINGHRVASAPGSHPTQPQAGAWWDRVRYAHNTGFPLNVNSHPLYVSVWPVVKLGKDEFTGPPLEIGPIGPNDGAFSG